MGFFNDYMREGKGVDKGIDMRPRFIVFFDIYFRKFWNLMLVNVMIILGCLPIVTIGPTLAGVTKILRNYAREEHAFVWSDFWDTFKQNFWKALIIGLADIVLFALIIFDAYIYVFSSMIQNSIYMTIILAILMLSATILLFMNYYIFVLMITFKLNFKQLIKNAFIFAWIGFWRNLLLTILIALLTFLGLIYITNIIGFIYIVFIYFALCGLLINFITYPLIKKHMIDGYDPKTGEKLEDNK